MTEQIWYTHLFCISLEVMMLWDSPVSVIWSQHNQFFSDKNQGDGTEAERLVQKYEHALIMAEIQEFEYSD